MKIVIIESPFAGCFPLNRAYLHAAIRDCLGRGETPYASHKMIPGALLDTEPGERERGILAGLAFSKELITRNDALVAFYEELGVSAGMNRRKGTLPEFARNEVRAIPEHEWERVAAEARRDELFAELYGGSTEPSGPLDLISTGRAWCELATQERKDRTALGF